MNVSNGGWESHGYGNEFRSIYFSRLQNGFRHAMLGPEQRNRTVRVSAQLFVYSSEHENRTASDGNAGRVAGVHIQRSCEKGGTLLGLGKAPEPAG